MVRPPTPLWECSLIWIKVLVRPPPFLEKFEEDIFLMKLEDFWSQIGGQHTWLEDVLLIRGPLWAMDIAIYIILPITPFYLL